MAEAGSYLPCLRAIARAGDGAVHGRALQRCWAVCPVPLMKGY